MEQPYQAAVLSVLARLPQWIRSDLAAADPAARQRAEETLAAMIADALAKDLPRAA
ncbi:conserved hypothetical protein [Altererythrobacter sp. B11]|uniref:hypothetical protein n=1 Tax=Altererythrobacter sp. B11 TaxID=2060312 RepID=UPI000DC6EE6B|nr:hypothetical protein [Altererythrobacter sp. B11]BBC74030.1 conserved hypothetical protein [Altererythrobacter sp. B11]